MRDHVDQLIESWASERPDLDTAAVSIVYRLTRIAAVWNVEIERVFQRHGITSTDFAVLSNLRRAPSPHQLHQRAIMSALRLTSGTVSLRIEKMVDRGLVTRAADPTDARASIVTLTEAGADLFDQVAPEHLANEARLIASLPEPQRDALAQTLRTILVDIEQPDEARPDHDLGFVVTPAPVAQRKRADVGLPSQHGLLVEAVTSGGRADRSGIRPGDTITHLDGVAQYSITCLEQALDGGPGRLSARLVRNGKPVTLDIDR